MKEELVFQVMTRVKEELKHAESGHDWWHIERVRRMSIYIAEQTGADRWITELGALLHDIADHKFHGGDQTVGPAAARQLLEELDCPEELISKIVHIVAHVSFKGGYFNQNLLTPELAAVRDADKLDALGAIGIARAFNYGGFKNRPFYDPNQPPTNYADAEAYNRNTAPTINHFYEKLLLLKDSLHTEAARKIAAERHQFLLTFLDQFYKEWNFNPVENAI